MIACPRAMAFLPIVRCYLVAVLLVSCSSLSPAASLITDIAVGEFHRLFIKNDGSLWGMGYNLYGQLGLGFKSFGEVRPRGPIVQDGVALISGGVGHTLFVKTDGSLWGMGCNTSGQLGDGTYTNCATPQLLISSGVIAASAGRFHSASAKSDGSLWGMGDNSYGQLGGYELGPQTNQPVRLAADKVVAAAAGDGFTLFRKSDGSLWAIGYNASGQLGDGFNDASCSFAEQVEPVPPMLLSVEVLGNNSLRCTAPSFIGGKYCLLRSEDPGMLLEQWTAVLTENIYGQSQGPFSITLTNFTTEVGPKSFFRLRFE
jgi:hypothetical protein